MIPVVRPTTMRLDAAAACAAAAAWAAERSSALD
jgi:hypothetical protein